MTWMTMHDGQEVSVQQPKLDDVTIERIAHNLSQINRFNGAACRPYSVAEHSLLCLDIAERVLGLNVFGQFATLMHDAHEAFCGDVIYPAKASLGQTWRAFEGNWEHLVDVKYSLVTNKFTHRREIAMCDRMALALEREQLLPTWQPNGKPVSPWPILAGAPLLTDIDLMDSGRVNMAWHEWRDAFTERFHELDAACTDLVQTRLKGQAA